MACLYWRRGKNCLKPKCSNWLGKGLSDSCKTKGEVPEKRPEKMGLGLMPEKCAIDL